MTTFGISADRPLKYTGSPLALVPTVKSPRAPTVNDKNWPVMTFWNDDSTSDIYCLTHFDSGDAIWELFISSAVSAVNTLTTDSGTATSVSNNIDVIGTAAQGISTSASGDTVTITIANATDTQKGVAIFDGTDFTVTNGTVTLASTPTAIDYITDSGTVTESSGEIEIFGGQNIATSGSGNTITIDFDGTLPVASGGTGQTSFTNGQLLIGNTTGNTLTKATLTAGTGISVTNGTGSITIEASAAVPTSFVADTGTATPAANILNVIGQNGISTVGSTDTLIIDGSGISNNLLINDFEKTIVAVCDFFTISGGYYDEGGNFVGSSTAPFVDSLPEHPGVMGNRSSGTNYRTLQLGSNFERNITIGSGVLTMELWYSWESVPTAGAIFFGLNNLSGPFTPTSFTDGIGFLISNAASSTEWSCVTRNTSTSTTTASGVSLSTDWVKLSIIVNADATSVAFYINDSLVATNATNIPSDSKAMLYQVGVYNTGSDYMFHDFIQLIYELTGDRA